MATTNRCETCGGALPDKSLPSVDDTIDVIRAYARSKMWSRWKLAKEAKMHDTTLRDFWKPNWNPNAVTLRILFAMVPDGFDPASAPSQDEHEHPL